MTKVPESDLSLSPATSAFPARSGSLPWFEQEVLKRVVHYYDEATIDYRLVWLNDDNQALHFGYYEDGVETHAEALRNANRVIADLAELKPGDRVLDAGCGVGGSSFWMAENRGVSAVGITIVHAHVRQARRLGAERGLGDRVSIELADYLDTGMAEASFDAAFALESSCHAEDKARFYAEMFRLLKPGGRLVIADYMRTGEALTEQGRRDVSEWLEGWSIPDIWTAEQHRSTSDDCGFEDIVVADYTPYTRRSLRRLYKLSLVALPIDAVLHRLGLRSRTQHLNVVASNRQYRALESGCWFYGVLTARKPIRNGG